MRRFVALSTAVVLLASCNPKELFTAHADVAAEAGDAQLAASRVAELMLSGKSPSLNREMADFVANMWVDYSLFAQAATKGEPLTDSATVAQAMWPQIAELTASHWFDTLVAKRSTLSASAVDAAYNGTAMRLFQHVLFTYGQSPSPEAKAKARKQAETAYADLKRGADFGALASKLSQDPGSARDSGFLPPAPKGRWVPSFDSAGWTLAPGETSGIVETAYGVHIIRRPSLAQARSRVEDWLRKQQVEAVSSAYMDSLGIANNLKMRGDAAETIKKAVEDPEHYLASPKTLAEFKGGQLDTKELLRWVQNFPPQMIQTIKSQPDSSLRNFGKMLAANVLLLRQADSAGVKPTAEEWTAIRDQYLGQVDSLKMEMGIASADTSMAQAEVNSKVDAYFESVATQKSRIRPLPAALSMVLRDRSEFDIRDAGLNEALDIARRRQAEVADSARANGQPVPGAPGQQMMPAPGGPPTPGAPPAQRGGN